ncbi:MAG: protoporphyrinogen oxidase [Gemmatimonadetes bacterium]|nr:protoporphyrinogen oxidase [Gemmatimonadota bacterium]
MGTVAQDGRTEGFADGVHDGRPSVAVVGGGITGLVAAYLLRQRGARVTLFEAADQVGGAIRTTRTDGFLAEHGPGAFLTSPLVEGLLDALGVGPAVVEASPSANRRYVVRDGALVPFPVRPLAMLTTPLLSPPAKLRVLMEPLVRTPSPSPDESVASFVRRRLGPEVLDYAVDPFVAGIFAGDPEQLSLRHAFPRVAELEAQHGSLSRGLMASRRRRPAPAGHEMPSEWPAPAHARARLVSFADGMQTLPEALGAALGDTVRCRCPVRLLHRQGARWVLEAGGEGAPVTCTVDAVVLATPAHVLAAMELPAELRQWSTAVERVDYPSMSTLVLGFMRDEVAHPLDGYGVLVPTVERRTLLGALFSSSLFPGRAPEGEVAISCFVGGAAGADRAREGTDLLVERLLLELRGLLGVDGEPTFVHHVYWPKGIPQYTVGYQAVKDAAASMETQHPGLYLAGNYRNGVSVGDCVAEGTEVAGRVGRFLGRRP